jgi:hypothetical protein
VTVLSAASLENVVRSVSDGFFRKRSLLRIVFGIGCSAWLIGHVSASFVCGSLCEEIHPPSLNTALQAVPSDDTPPLHLTGRLGEWS